MQLSVITPEKEILKEENVSQVTVPTVNGQITILPHHVGLLTRLDSGELIIKKGQKTDNLAVTGGYLEVRKDSISILADYAVRSSDINIAKAEEARKRAEKAMKEKVSERDFAVAQAELRRSLLELDVANRRRRNPA